MGFFKRLFGGKDDGPAPGSRPAEEAADESSVWGVFLTERDGAPTCIAVDQQWMERGPRRDLAVCIEVAIPLKGAGPQGMPGPDEMDALGPIEDNVVAALERVGAVFTGTVTQRGSRRMVFYAARADVAGQVQTAMGRQYTAHVKAEQDPGWSKYSRELAPTPREQRRAQDTQVLMALAQQGDIGERERTIDHYAYFEDEARSQRFAAWAKGEGYTIAQMLKPGGERDMYGVHFTHVGPATPGISLHTEACEMKARELGGMYDGWGTSVKK